VPLLLHARDPRRGELVMACNAAARERGVRLGMPLAEAAALAGKKVDGARDPAILERHDPATDLAALAHLAEGCEQFSPLVGWDTAGSSERTLPGSKTAADFAPRIAGYSLGPDGLFLDVTGISVLFGGEASLARAVSAEAARRGYELRIGIADTIGAAWAKAKYEGRTTKDEAEALLLPLAALRLGEATLERLAQLGITQLDQLLALPRASLRSRFGEEVLLRVDQFFGATEETIVAHRPPPRFSADWILEYPAEQREVVGQIATELIRRVAGSLAERREGAVQLSCRLDCAPGRMLRLEVGIFRPSAEAAHLAELLRMQLERASLSGPVGRITLTAPLTAPLENRQGELFAGHEHEAVRHLALFIDRTRSRLGSAAVVQPELTADPLPERAVRDRPLQASRGTTRKGTKNRKAKSRTAKVDVSLEMSSPIRAHERPLTLHDPPLELQVVSVAPDGPPISFHFEGHEQQVVASWGPERIEAGWWRGASIRRDYWRVQTACGRRYWFFRNLRDRHWRLHGEY
jgi:protein ImuB